MLKHLTIVALVGALLPACVLTTGDTVTDTNLTSETSTSTTGGTTADGTIGTTGGTAEGTSGTTSGTTAEVPTTGEPTTGEGTTIEDTTSGTTGSTGPFGMCGWVADMNFYGCADEGAAPGVSDPADIDPIACPPDLVAGDPCNEKEGPVKNVGCCAPNGDLFLCNSQGPMPTDTITKIECGA